MRCACISLGKSIVVLAIFLLLTLPASAQNVVFVVIDGARYSETFGDPQRTYVPAMEALSHQGTLVDEFYNDGFTYTSRAIPALWCGSWTEVADTTYEGIDTQYAVDPTIFEYYRKQKGAGEDSCFYVLKYIFSLWLPSFHQEYGPGYWPTIHSEGGSDIDVLHETLQVIQSHHPQLLWVYFADVDHEGHSGDWERYTRAIQIADSLVGVLWGALQADPVYQNTTTMIVTNDHGRHDDEHGGFSGHGCGCDGCRHIMLLAVGPELRRDFVSTRTRVLPDATVTAMHLLEIRPEYSTGAVMDELFESTDVASRKAVRVPAQFTLLQNVPNPFNPVTTIAYSMAKPGTVRLAVYDVRGRLVAVLRQGYAGAETYRAVFNGNGFPSGVYFYRLTVDGMQQNRRMTMVK